MVLAARQPLPEDETDRIIGIRRFVDTCPWSQITHDPERMTVLPTGSSPSLQTWMRSGPNTR